MKNILSESSTVTAAKEQVSCDLQGEAVVLNLKSGVYYGLDGVGAAIWRLIREPKTIRELRDALTEEYDVQPERCEKDLRVFLHDMESHGLLRTEKG